MSDLTPTVAEVLRGYTGNPIASGDLSGDATAAPPYTIDPTSTDNEAEALIVEAVNMFQENYSDRVLFQNETEDPTTAVRYLCRHKWALALGDTVQSEGQGGASVTYNVPTSTDTSLMRTEYGQEFAEYLTNIPNVGVVKGR